MSELPQSEKQLAEPAKMIEKLGSRNEAERAVARQYLDSLGDRKFDVLLMVLKSEAAKRKRRNRGFLIGFGIYVVFIVALLSMLALFKRHIDLSDFVGFFYMVIFAGVAFAATGVQKNAMQEIAYIEDKRAVGVWAEALELDDKSIIEMGRKNLIALLPKLNASDAHLLNDDQRAILYRALNKRGHGLPLQRAILTALGQVGDEKAIPYVEKLAKGEGIAVRVPELQDAAAECLPLLKVSAQQLRASQTLLRASSAADAISSHPDTLLRPALDAGTTAPQELLRASLSETLTSEPLTEANRIQ